MASWYSNLLTKTSSQISNLQSRLLSSEADGDTEDDTHVCRVLRHHYTEAGRPFPPWLPADPRAPVAQAPVQPLYAQSQQQLGGRMGQQQQHQSHGSGGSGGGLSSLWGDNSGGGGGAPGVPQSLRAGRGPRGSAHMGDDVQARPLPSQRAGSYQNPGQARGPSPGPAVGGGVPTAQDRLKQRLWGGSGSRGASPTQNAPYQAPPPQQQQQQYQQQPPSQGGGNYEDRFAPGGGYGPPVGGGRRPGLPSGPRGYSRG